MNGSRWIVPVGVFLILLGSSSYFWHSRDWNGASRLMLTYAMVDRVTISLDGLNRQTNDLARFQGHYYSDKMPGFSLLAVVPYAVERGVFHLPAHPLNRPALDHWPADYWTTLGTSGLLTALTGALLAVLARNLGCGPRRSALVGLAYGLATPAFVYSTLPYGHQATAFALLASFALLNQSNPRQGAIRAALAGGLASFAAVIELQVGPVSAVLGLYAVVQALGGRMRWSNVVAFGAGAIVPALVLLGYNLLAFGSPFDMGYSHEVLTLFARVHSADHPLGLTSPVWERAPALLWGWYRGLLVYAPILILAVPGWMLLAAGRRWGIAIVSLAVCVLVFLVNLSYPEWTGGWSTGPRLLVPLLPFAMLPVAALLGVGGRWTTTLALALALAGGTLMLLFQGVGARVPQYYPNQIEVVWSLWRGDPLPPGWVGDRFARNLVSWSRSDTLSRWFSGRDGMQFLPLVVAQVVAILSLIVLVRLASIAASKALRRPPRERSGTA